MKKSSNFKLASRSRIMDTNRDKSYCATLFLLSRNSPKIEPRLTYLFSVKKKRMANTIPKEILVKVWSLVDFKTLHFGMQSTVIPMVQ